MEKNSASSNMNKHSITNSTRNMKQIHGFKVNKGLSWDYGNEYDSCWGEADLVAAGFSWPPRSYICSFCKREFRSAQALGGHMNVHRRDRARLRQYSPARDGCNNNNGGQFSPLNLKLDSNPTVSSNPSSNPTSFPSLLPKFPKFTSKLPRLGPLPSVQVQNFRPITADLMKPKAAKALLGVETFDSSENEKGFGDFEKSESIRLALEIGLVSQSNEELDLELRLGYI